MNGKIYGLLGIGFVLVGFIPLILILVNAIIFEDMKSAWNWFFWLLLHFASLFIYFSIGKTDLVTNG